MEIWQIGMLLAGGMFGGIAAALAGGAAVFTFPAMLAVGVPPLSTVGTNMLALCPGTFLAAIFDRGQLPRSWDFLLLLMAAIIGTSTGASLLLLTPERLFQWLIPILIGIATILIAFSETIGRTLADRAKARNPGETTDTNWRRSIIPIIPVTMYGGYFGAGIGILVLGALAVGTQGDYRSANATKNLLFSICSALAIAIFAINGRIAWTEGLIMTAGGIIGGNIGARIARIAPKTIMRRVIVAIGILLTILFAQRYWF